MARAPTFKSGLDGIVWPSVPTGEAATIATLVAHLQASERLPLAEIEAGQGAQLARLASAPRPPLAGVSRPAGGGRARCRGARRASPGCASWECSRGSSFRRPARTFSRRRCRAATSRSAKSITSGSTGEPVKLKKTVVGRLFWAACRSATTSGTAATSAAG